MWCPGEKESALRAKKKKKKFRLKTYYKYKNKLRKKKHAFVYFPFFTHVSIWPFKKSRKIIDFRLKIISLTCSKCSLWEQEC